MKNRTEISFDEAFAAMFAESDNKRAKAKNFIEENNYEKYITEFVPGTVYNGYEIHGENGQKYAIKGDSGKLLIRKKRFLDFDTNIYVEYDFFVDQVPNAENEFCMYQSNNKKYYIRNKMI